MRVNYTPQIMNLLSTPLPPTTAPPTRVIHPSTYPTHPLPFPPPLFAAPVHMQSILKCADLKAGVQYTPRFTYHGFRYMQLGGWDTAALGPPPIG